MPLQFAVTLFVSASLLFMVQPMVGKMILPLLGGSPAVWNACMVFFQTLLLLGYLYAHHISTKYEPRKQWVIHTCVLAVPLAVMALAAILGPKHTPIAIAEWLAPTGTSNPFVSVMGLMAVAIGIPFFVSSTSAPLLQKWFAYTGHPSSRDPYFLYAASNAGSLISLLGYPLFMESVFSPAEQAWIWAGGFTLLVGLIVACGHSAANPIGTPPPADPAPVRGGMAPHPAASESAPSWARIARWIAYAFVPSSLMLGVTFYMTTDIASVPLLWVIPLALYLLTFIIAFMKLPPWFRMVIGNLAPVMILLLVFVMVAARVIPVGVGITLLLHVVTFFAVALMCHYELALDRPKDVAHLTTYFLCMSVGGVLGGLFNALVAPNVFLYAYEYHVTIVLACLLVPVLLADTGRKGPIELQQYRAKVALLLDFAVPVLIGLGFWVLVDFIPQSGWYNKAVEWVHEKFAISERTIMAISLYAVPVMACFFFVDRPHRFATCVAVLVAIHLYRDRDRDVIYAERSFFGILKVEKEVTHYRPAIRNDEGATIPSRTMTAFRLVHGTTLHGTQIREDRAFFDTFKALTVLNPWDNLAAAGVLHQFDIRGEPLTYYHRTGPVGAMFQELRRRKGGADATAPFAMVGLGTGSVSCYALPGQHLTFYEIDPAVKRLVADTDEYFTYVTDARRRGAEVEIRMGDARLKLKEDADRKYALLLIDAFSSDAIPVHLLTREAVEMYMDRLTADGILALHISNKYIRLEPVAARIAAELGLEARVWNDGNEGGPGKTASSWVVVAKDAQTLGSLAAPVPAQVLAFGTENLALKDLLGKYGADADAADVLTREYGADFAAPAAGPDAKAGGLAVEDFGRKYGSSAAQLVRLVRLSEAEKQKPEAGEVDKQKLTLGRLAESPQLYGRMFHPLKVEPGVRLWTDDYTDVLQVMMLKEVQSVRKFFGLTTAGQEE